MQHRGKGFNFEFALLVCIAFFLSYVPYVDIPFTWVMTFFHEISHGLAALLTGGSITKIQLHLQGSGLCYTIGGSRFIVLQAGYIGAVAWGMLIYSMAERLSQKNTSRLALLLAGLIVCAGVLYGRDPITWTIMLVLLGLFISVIKLQGTFFMKLLLKFIGIYVLLDAVRAPLHLIDGRDFGDGAALSNLTGIPELFWVLLWLAIGVAGAAQMAFSNKQK